MTSRFSAQQLRAQVRAAVDPTGEQTALLAAVAATDKQTWVQLLGADAGRQWEELSAHRSSHAALMASTDDALELLVPAGWAPFQMDTATVTAAIDLARSGDTAADDDLLALQWEGEGAWRTERVCDRVRTMGAGARQDDHEALFHERARLLTKAKQHHEAGSYEASIPILHSQMEGLVIDVAGGAKFFTKRSDRANLSDPTQLITIEACLPVLQGLFSEGVPGTQTDGALSRHGVAHGRELAYDTKVNSAKCWSVLDAIVEWAKPLAHAEAEHRLAKQQSQRAGSQDVDDEGRRLDDREFRETRNVLTLLGCSAIGHRRNTGSLRTDLIGGVYTTADLVKRGLPVDHQVRMATSEDGDVAWYWRRTVTGWVLAYAVALDNGNMIDWYFTGPDEPSGPPGSDRGWSERFVRPPDWSEHSDDGNEMSTSEPHPESPIKRHFTLEDLREKARTNPPDLEEIRRGLTAMSRAGLESIASDICELAEAAKTALAQSDEITRLARQVRFDFTPLLSGDHFTELLDGVRTLAVSVKKKLPPNWPSRLDWDAALAVIRNDGIPLIWVPRAEIVSLIVGQTDRSERLQVILDHSNDIMDDCQEALSLVVDPSISGQVQLARAAVAACAGGHPEAAQALAVVVTETAIASALNEDYKDVKRQVGVELVDQPIAELRLRAALAPIARFYTPWKPSWGTPPPDSLSRHVTVHQADPAHYTRANGHLAMLLVSSVLPAIQEMRQLVAEVG